MTQINAETATMQQSQPASEAEALNQYEMTRQLSEKMRVTLGEAKGALEASNWNMLTATYLLEQDQFRRMRELSEFAEPAQAQADRAEAADAQAQSAEKAAPAPKKARGRGFRNLWEHIRRLVASGNRQRFAIHREGEQLLEMPVTALALLLLFSFGTCAVLLAIGLFAGCRYSIDGKGVAVGA